MFEKIKKLQHHPVVDQFRDVRAVGFVIFGVVVLLVSWSGVNVIQTNYTLQKQVAELRQKNQVAELENANMKLQNQYYNTDQYLELAARQQFGKGMPGETLILVPKDAALAHTLPPVMAIAEAVQQHKSKPIYQKNFEAWKNFLFHR